MVAGVADEVWSGSVGSEMMLVKGRSGYDLRKSHAAARQTSAITKADDSFHIVFAECWRRRSCSRDEDLSSGVAYELPNEQTMSKLGRDVCSAPNFTSIQRQDLADTASDDVDCL